MFFLLSDFSGRYPCFSLRLFSVIAMVEVEVEVIVDGKVEVEVEVKVGVEVIVDGKVDVCRFCLFSLKRFATSFENVFSLLFFSLADPSGLSLISAVVGVMADILKLLFGNSLTDFIHQLPWPQYPYFLMFLVEIPGNPNP